MLNLRMKSFGVSSSRAWATIIFFLLIGLIAGGCESKTPELPQKPLSEETGDVCLEPNKIAPNGTCIVASDFDHCQSKKTDTSGNCMSWGFEGYSDSNETQDCNGDEKKAPSGDCVFSDAYDHCESGLADPSGNCELWGFEGYGDSSLPKDDLQSCEGVTKQAPSGVCIDQSDYDQCASNPSSMVDKCRDWGFDVTPEAPPPEPEMPRTPCEDGKEEAPNGECILAKDFHYCSLGAWDGTGRCKQWQFPGY